MDRRKFLKTLSLGAAGLVSSQAAAKGVGLFSSKATKIKMDTTPSNIVVPSYLKDYKTLYIQNPHAAAMQWFKEAKFGMFIHFGLYSIPARGEWVQYNEKIHVAEYALFKDDFTAEHFDADMITDLVLEAGMKYINITTRHHDCFCLFDTAQTDFKSENSPAGRDLVGELAEACKEKGLGLFFYYSHGRDWRHPDAPNNDEWGGSARPRFYTQEPFYHYGEEHDLQRYLDFMKAQISELMTNYGPIAGIWLDGIGVPLSRDKTVFKCQALYDMIHKLQPNALVSYKTGLLKTEDFYAPERNTTLTGKQIEICNTLQPKLWGYSSADDGNHKTADWVMDELANAATKNANMLLNTGPLPDGTIHPEDVVTLKEVGRRLKDNA